VHIPEPTRRYSGSRIFLELLQRSHAQQLLDYRKRNFTYHRPYSPAQDERELQLSDQEALIAGYLERANRDQGYYFGVFLRHGGTLIGQMNLNNVVRGAFQNAHVGYSMDEAHTGQGLMSEALGIACEVAFSVIALHRLQAAVMPWNIASIRVVEKNAFRKEGFAPDYLKIAGRWEDHVIFARRVDQELSPLFGDGTSS
jgi:ribosomal-protein-alanine N-acetyltransferase